MTTQKKIDEAAIKYNKTKDPYYKDLWYKLVKEFADGADYFKRRTVSISSCHKNNNGEYLIIGRSRLHGSVRNIKTKTNRLR
tara:strand:- start:338 stop:583 length:246 start_codon:yes stop_codon:yes gene_type:complete